MKTRNLRTPLAALPLAILATISHAQTQTLPTTVVTATRFNEEASSLPLGVSVITAEAIRQAGVTTVNEAIIRLLGVAGRQDLYGGGDYSLDLRGFGATSDNNQAVILDGVRLNEADLGGTRLAGIPIDTVERIEVLRGSGAVLYGEGATGGVVVITTKAGMGKARQTGMSAYVGIGSNSLRDARVNGTLASGGFSVDVYGQRRDTDNHRENFRSKTDGAGITGQWSNDWLRLGVRHTQDALDTRLPGSLTAAQFVANPNQSLTPNDLARIRNDSHGVFGEAVLGDWQLVADLGWRNKRLDSTQSGFSSGYDVDAEQVAIRAKHERDWLGGRNALVVGHDQGRWSRVNRSLVTARQESNAWYLKNDFTWSSGTRLSAGWRTESLDKTAGNGASALDDRLNAWELGLSQSLSSATTAWARLGTSYRLGNVDEFSFTSPSVAIRPQTSKDIEAGLRWASGAYKLEARLYRSSLTDEIGYDPDADGPSSAFGFNGANVNFDPTRRQGIEFDGDWAVSRQLNLGARLALRQARFRSGPYAGKDVPLVPRQTLALRADWTPVAGHRLTGGVNIVGSQSPDFANQCNMPSYATADLRYAYQWNKAELSFGISNLFDRSYYTQAFTCTGGVTNGIYPEAGRTFTAAVRVAF